MSRLAAPAYREIREVLASEYRDLPAEKIELLVRESLGNVDPEDVEDFLGTLKKIGGAVAKAAPSILPVAGTVLGTAFGGPIGATLGGSLGSLAGRAIGGAAAPRPGAPGLPAATGGAPAAGHLLALLNRPEITQALMSLLMGHAGRSHVPVAGTPVPVAAVAHTVGALAQQAVAEHQAAVSWDSESLAPLYLQDARGEFCCDPAVPEERAAAVLRLFEASQRESCANRQAGRSTWYEAESDESDESDDSEWFDEQALDDQLLDELELSDLYSASEAWEA